jgi:Ca2+-binding EF-hand superfamily protein
LTELFDKFDVDNDNRLNLEEIDCFLKHIFERRGRPETAVNEDLIVNFIKSAGEKHGESISREEFISFYRK